MGRKRALVAEGTEDQAVKQGLCPRSLKPLKGFKLVMTKLEFFCFRKLPLVAGLREGLETWTGMD